jgi:hypothetical protein
MAAVLFDSIRRQASSQAFAVCVNIPDNQNSNNKNKKLNNITIDFNKEQT